MTNSRSAGILLHITSLPSPFGVGDFGASAYEFVDFLCDAGQSVWQVLPLCPTAQGNSPYSSYSAFAGSMLLISPESLARAGWISESSYTAWTHDYESSASKNLSEVDFENVTKFKRQLLQTAFDESSESLDSCAEFAQFCEENAWWLDNFASFEALKEITGEDDWTTWPLDCREPNKLNQSTIPRFANRAFVLEVQAVYF